jgi:hypothetical protein
MAIFVQDSFTDTAAVALASHTPEVGGPWVLHPSNAAGFEISDANRVRPNLIGNGYAYATGTPGTDYDVKADFRKRSSVGTGTQFGITGRMSTTVVTMYYLHYNDGAAQWQMGRVVTGGNATLGTFAQALTIDQNYAITLRMQGTAISAYIDGVLRIGPITDANIAAAGKGGIKSAGSVATASNTTGYHIDKFLAQDIPVVASTYKDSGSIGASGLWVPNRRETRIMVPE